jgi:hypothetical protein
VKLLSQTRNNESLAYIGRRTRSSTPFYPQMAVPRLRLRIAVVQFNPKVRESQTSPTTLSNCHKF